MPATVDDEAERVMVVLHVGVQEVGEKDAVAPTGSPDTERAVATGVPVLSVRETLAMTDCPWVRVADVGATAMSNLNGITVRV